MSHLRVAYHRVLRVRDPKHLEEKICDLLLEVGASHVGKELSWSLHTIGEG